MEHPYTMAWTHGVRRDCFALGIAEAIANDEKKILKKTATELQDFAEEISVASYVIALELEKEGARIDAL